MKKTAAEKIETTMKKNFRTVKNPPYKGTVTCDEIDAAIHKIAERAANKRSSAYSQNKARQAA